MRPTLLEMSGFSAFRERTVVDFGDADLFALVGPTGAGKSSIIDAIVFALYGSVSRYRNTNLVAPVINQLSNEARVRLDFTLGGHDFTAVRVVRRTRTGATTKEARLERGDEVIAGSARELDDAVAALVGLSFDQFTRTVVLPQGEFAQFLTDTSTDRQALLRRLLGLELFRSMATAARERGRAAAAGRDARVSQVESESVTEETVAQLEQRVAGLRDVARDLRTEVESIASERAAADRATAAVAALEVDLNLLAAIEVPDDLADLAERLAAADSQLDDAEREVQDLARVIEDTESEIPEPAEVDRLRDVVEASGRLHDVTTDLEAAERRLEESFQTLAKVETELETVERRLEELTEEAAELDRRMGAATFRNALRVGEPCPICDQAVKTLPDRHVHADSDDLATERAELVARRAELSKRRSTALRTDAESQAIVNRLHEEQTELRTRIGTSDIEKIVRDLEAFELAAQRRDGARRAAEAAIRSLNEATAYRRRLDEQIDDRQREFVAFRDRLVHLEPEAAGGSTLVEQWSQLRDWAAGQLVARSELVAETRAHHQAALDRAAKHEAVLSDLISPFTDREPDDILGWHATELALSEERLTIAEERLERVADLRAEIDELDSEHSVASTLGRLLGADGFEQWLMEDAMSVLADTASVRLLELSDGAYSLVVAGSDFAVCDHRNADEIRGARSLSGGETFLASLSLALALADSISELSTINAPVVDTILLDEGFGTLDAETLDVVAATIEELGASGRMVGIITHIAELAGRVPTRFEVRRGVGSSTVRRVDQ